MDNNLSPSFSAQASSLTSRRHQGLLLAGILLIATNLRPGLSSVSPVLGPLGSLFHLGPLALAALAALPVLCFAALAPASLTLQRWLGLERAMLAALLLLCTGLVLRLAGTATLLFTGTIGAGAGIAIANVLLPAIVKRDFAAHAGMVTGLYTTTLNGAAALGAAIAVPLMQGTRLGWRAALGIWAIPAAAAIVLWLPQLRHRAGRLFTPNRADSFRRLLRAPLAWHVAMFMGMQSLGFYAVLSWLPSILESHGIAAAQAGFMLSLTTIVAIPVSLVTPSIAMRQTDQRRSVIGIVGITAAGYIGLALAPAAAPWLWCVLIGVGQGAAFPLALTLIVLRAESSTEAISLSAVSQGIGYTVAFFGPLGLGAIHAFAGWKPACWVLAATVLPELLFGLAAARNRVIRL
jgi:CP family cyanate transporter-like MFS transporter